MTTALAARTSPLSHTDRPLVRLLPAPDLEPPFEDEGGPPERHRADEPATGDTGVELGFALEWPMDRARRPGGPAAAPISEAKLAAHRYLALCVEILGGFRPMAQLRALTRDTAFDRVATELTRPWAAGRTGRPPRPAGRATGAAARAAAPRAAAAPWFPDVRPGAGRLPYSARLTPPPGARITLRHLRVCEPSEGVAEVAAVLGRGGQVCAMALRLERHRGVWLCSHLEVV